MRWKKNKQKIIVSMLVIAVLAAAFWYGDGSSRPAEETETESEHQTEMTVSSVPAEMPVSAPSSAETRQPMTAPAQPPDVPEAAEIAETPSSPTEKHCMISISCASILDHMDRIEPAKTALVPEDGWLLGSIDAVFTEGESVFDVLLRVCTEKKIHMEFSVTPVYQSAYIEGIGNLYEFDCGELSGWMYRVNGQFPNYGCSQYTLSDGDVIEWLYTCDLGKDVGGALAAQQ